MKLNLRGHEDRYAIEQSLLAFFPEERPVYEGEDGDSHAEVTLHEGNVYATGVTTLTYGGKTARGEARVRTAGVSDAYERERLRQRALKLSFFRAARDVTGVTPSWGALTGIRPAKLVRTMLEDGMTPAQADRVLRDTYCVSPARRRLALESAEAGLKARSDLRPEDISLYIGIPFCPTRCAYCSFVSVDAPKLLKSIPDYLNALEQEMRSTAAAVKAAGRRVVAVYIGGGTPTSLSAAQLRQLMGTVRQNFDLSKVVEYTVEAGRPDCTDAEKLAVIKEYGATRISINPQTFSDEVLAGIGRKHSAQDILDCYAEARKAGHDDINMDLIAGLPEDTPEGFARSLDEVISMGADNITVHTLSLKKGSRIMLEGSRIPGADEVAQMLDYADPTLRKHGFAPYYLYRQKYMSGSFENVGWTKPGGTGLYNIYIMEELHSILSLGAGGSTKMVGGGQIRRAFNAKYPREYIDRPEKRRANLMDFARFYAEQGE